MPRQVIQEQFIALLECTGVIPQLHVTPEVPISKE